MDKIKKFSSIISIIFLISIVFILGAKKFNWPVNITFVRIFIVILVVLGSSFLFSILSYYSIGKGTT